MGGHVSGRQGGTSAAGHYAEITGDGAKKTYDIDHDALDHPFKDVPGVGDEAHQEDSAIFFRSGSTWAGITVVTLDDPRTVVRPLQDAAKVIISRLP